MAEINDLNITDASNTARFPEQQASSTVNDGARSLEGLLARGFKDAVEGDRDSTGSANAYAVAANRTISAYYDGMRIGFHANFANTGAATLNVDAVGAKSIKKNHDVALASGDIEANQYVEVIYSATDDAFQMISPLGAASQKDVITTRGDVIRGSSTGVAERLALGTNGQVLGSDGTDLAWANRITLATEQAASTPNDFTGIPSWVKRITIMFVGVSVDASGGNILIQIGDSGGIEATGYLGAGSRMASASQTVTNATSAFLILNGADAAILHGGVTLTLEDSANNTWVASGFLARSDITEVMGVAGSKSLTATLDRVRISTTVGDFDAGAFNILYE